ncbi:3'-5' exonuclease [Nocardiopsis halophila]|uniref:3'-5' exonuclease n=1 Tax=Nocardiopsis halophila TaxID=141692 RepID=UPI00034BEDD7|nr:3'-5' exonuclease [Nocardiopsis halophila]
MEARDHRALRQRLEPLLRRAWEDMCDPEGTLFRFRHDTYVKIWQLSPEPRIRVGGQGRGYVLVDEAQDINPVAEDILRRQDHLQQIWVGDSAQAIHAWRGAIDALDRQGPDVTLSLTQSFRFGGAVAAEANKFLELLGAPLRVRGTPQLDTRVSDGPMEEPEAVLCRTNAGAFTEALAQLRAGRRVAIVGGTDDLMRLVEAAEALQEGKRTTHPDLALFGSWGQVMRCVAETPEDLGQLATFARLVDQQGTEEVRRALEQMSAADPQVWISTAHKAKGLEFDRVRIGDDFPAPPGIDPEADEGRRQTFDLKAEAQLAYVAVTRARAELDRGSLAWIEEMQPAHTADAGGEQEQRAEREQAPDAAQDAEPPGEQEAAQQAPTEQEARAEQTAHEDQEAAEPPREAAPPSQEPGREQEPPAAQDREAEPQPGVATARGARRLRGLRGTPGRPSGLSAPEQEQPEPVQEHAPGGDPRHEAAEADTAQQDQEAPADEPQDAEPLPLFDEELQQQAPLQGAAAHDGDKEAPAAQQEQPVRPAPEPGGPASQDEPAREEAGGQDQQAPADGQEPQAEQDAPEPEPPGHQDQQPLWETDPEAAPREEDQAGEAGAGGDGTAPALPEGGPGFGLQPGDGAAVLLRYPQEDLPGPLPQLLIGTYLGGSDDADGFLRLRQADQDHRVAANNVEEVTTTGGTTTWRREPEREPLIEDMLGLHALTLAPHAPEQLDEVLDGLSRLAPRLPTLDFPTQIDALSRGQASTHQRQFTHALLDLLSDGDREQPLTPTDPRIAEAPAQRRDLARTLIAVADKRSPLGMWERSALRSTLAYADTAHIPDDVVRIEASLSGVTVRTAPESPSISEVDEVLRSRGIGFQRLGATAAWVAPQSVGYEARQVQLRKALYALHRRGVPAITEERWQQIATGSVPAPEAAREQDGPAPLAQMLPTGQETAAARERSPEGTPGPVSPADETPDAQPADDSGAAAPPPEAARPAPPTNEAQQPQPATARPQEQAPTAEDRGRPDAEVQAHRARIEEHITALERAGRRTSEERRSALLRALHEGAEALPPADLRQLMARADAGDSAGAWEREQLRSRLQDLQITPGVVRVERDGRNIVVRGVAPQDRQLVGELERLGFSRSHDLWASSSLMAKSQDKRLVELLRSLEAMGRERITEDQHERLHGPEKSAQSTQKSAGEPMAEYGSLQSNFASSDQQDEQRSSRVKTNGPGRPPHMRINVVNDQSDHEPQRSDAPAPQAGAPRPAPQAPNPAPPPAQAPQPAPEAPAPGPGSGGDGDKNTTGPVVIDARQLRVKHKEWKDTLVKEGRAAAIAKVDPDMHKRAEEMSTKAMKKGQDVHLVLPSNDPKAIADHIERAKEAGYTVTLAVRVTPEAERLMKTLDNLEAHARNRTAHQAVWPGEQEREVDNMQTLLKRAYQEKAVDSIQLYPASGNKPAYTANLNHDHDANGNRTASTWDNPHPVEETIGAMRDASLSPQQQQELRSRVVEMGKRLPAPETCDGVGLTARNELAKGLNELAQAMNMDPVDPELARKSTMATSDQPHHDGAHQQPPQHDPYANIPDISEGASVRSTNGGTWGGPEGGQQPHQAPPQPQHRQTAGAAPSMG